jgi:Putative metal-binding motif
MRRRWALVSEGKSSMRRLEVVALGSVVLATLVSACGGDDVPGASASASDSRTTGLDGTVGEGDTTVGGTATDGVGTGNGSGGSDATASVDDTVGGDTASGGSTSNTSNTSNGTTEGSEAGETDSGGNDPGPVPGVFPGVEVGLCAPPGEVQWCYTGAPATYGLGQCQPGTQQCQALDLDVGEWGECDDETLPQLEVCDGVDNDCNGEVDDGQGVTACGMGTCAHEVPNCVAGEEQMCDPFDGAQPEICNGEDDDCDGDIDDGLGDGTQTCGVGACEHDVTGCEGGIIPPCDPFEGAMPEVCDDVDNDCDGATDEGLPDLTCGCGECDHTVPSCINGFPQICDPYDGASPEICDGLDNDCDCIVDEDQGNWTCGENECEVSVPQCIDGVPQPENTCMPVPGGSEICGDGTDNNCDGVAPPCAETFLVGTDTVARPIDVIWAVDSSGSMSEEMATVEAEINAFANTLAGSTSSTQLHLVADRGTESFEICVSPPLGGAACADNAGAGFWQYDTNGGTNGNEMVHSSNALGRIMQQQGTWTPRLQPNSYIAFIITTDDNGDDPLWGAAQGDPTELDDCGVGFIVNGTTANICRWDAPGALDYTSLAYDFMGYAGFSTFMTNFFPSYAVADDWGVYPIIGNTGTAVLMGANDMYEFNSCATSAENGEEYVKLALLTDTLDSMFSICDAPWDLSGLADDILSGVPNDLYVLSGVPAGTCGLINPATITVVVNGIPMAPADWVYDALSCTLQVINNVPVVGDNVVIVYENF